MYDIKSDYYKAKNKFSVKNFSPVDIARMITFAILLIPVTFFTLFFRWRLQHFVRKN